MMSKSMGTLETIQQNLLLDLDLILNLELFQLERYIGQLCSLKEKNQFLFNSCGGENFMAI